MAALSALEVTFARREKLELEKQCNDSFFVKAQRRIQAMLSTGKVLSRVWDQEFVGQARGAS